MHLSRCSLRRMGRRWLVSFSSATSLTSGFESCLFFLKPYSHFLPIFRLREYSQTGEKRESTLPRFFIYQQLTQLEFHSDLVLLHPLPSVGYLDKIKSAINNRLISEHKVDLVKTGVDFSERWRRIIQDLPGLEKWKTKKDRGSLESTLPKKLRPTQ